jgi:hypothetical protein
MADDSGAGSGSSHPCAGRAWRNTDQGSKGGAAHRYSGAEPARLLTLCVASWFAAIEKQALALGDYSMAGFEDECAVERKDLPDLVRSFTTDRAAFISRLKQSATYRHRLLGITSAIRGAFASHSSCTTSALTIQADSGMCLDPWFLDCMVTPSYSNANSRITGGSA